MNRIASLFLILFLAIPVSHAEEPVSRNPGPYDKLITKMVTRMLQQQHYAHPEVDNANSEVFFKEYFEALDPNHYYFLKSDIAAFDGYRDLLDDNLKEGDLTFAFAVFERFLQRAEERVAFVRERMKQPFDFTIDESITVDRTEADWPETLEEMNDLWRKQLKNLILLDTLRAEEATKDTNTEDAPSEIAKSMSVETRTIKRFENFYNYMKDYTTSDVLEAYLTAFSKTFDPHSVYWNSNSLEDFNIQMQLKLQGIGATLSYDNGYTKVESLVPGGPADLQGELKEGDLIIAVTQENGDTVDVVDMPLNRVVQNIRGPADTKVKLTTIASLSSPHHDITITRGEVQLKDSEASGEVRQVKLSSGREIKVGVIDLPSFYADFEGQRKGDKDAASTSGDVRRLIDKMIAEDHIEGIIIDLRTNGGGSLVEAIKLTGLFIPIGPVVQVQRFTPARVGNDVDWRMQVKVEEDDDNFTYDLPLVVMTNRLSASASEIFAGAIQDYGRGLIVGDAATHGKGTVQTISDLDERYPLLRKVKPGAVKYTMAKFYRVTGASTQNKGVTPDITFPSFLDHMDMGEARLKHVMPWDEIKPQPITPGKTRVADAIDIVRARSVQRRESSEKFKALAETIEHYGERREALKQITLNKDKRRQLMEEEKEWSKKREDVLGADRRKSDKHKNDDKTAAAGKDKDKDKDKGPDLYLDESVAITGDLIAIGGTDKTVTVLSVAPPAETATAVQQ